MPYPATPKTWIAGDVLTAAQMNAQLRDALLAAFPLGVDAWTSYTPTLVQPGAIAKTVTRARYQRVGRTIHAVISLAVTGAGTAGSRIAVGLPVTAAAFQFPVGSFRLYDLSTNLQYTGTAWLDSTTTCGFLAGIAQAAGFLGEAASVFNQAIASGDGIDVFLTYEAAS